MKLPIPILANNERRKTLEEIKHVSDGNEFFVSVLSELA